MAEDLPFSLVTTFQPCYLLFIFVNIVVDVGCRWSRLGEGKLICHAVLGGAALEGRLLDSGDKSYALIIIFLHHFLHFRLVYIITMY